MSSVSFREKLETRVQKVQSLLCVGLDPHVSQLKTATPASAREFCAKIIAETHPYAACFKPNVAFFEYFGQEGVAVLHDILNLIPEDIPVILDAKRGDIDTTAQAYADAAFKGTRADSITLSPYMGWDSISPFVTNTYKGKGAFVLCKTSNKSSSELQSISTMDGRSMFESVLDCCLRWQQHEPESLIGIVAGATDVDSLKKIRENAPDIWILCPGVGAQGGEPHRVCPVGLRNDASGILISVSRALSKADDMAAAAIALRDEINQLRQEKLASVAAASADTSKQLRSYQRDFIEFALSQRALQFGSFTLKSGRTSPYFFNAGNLCSGRSISMLGRCYAQAIHDAGVQFDVVFGPAYKGIPLATAFAMAWFEMFGESKDVSYNRKEVKDHGEGGLLVGAGVRGQRVLIIDDVITAGTAIRESVNFLVASGAQIVGTVVSLDRQERAGDAGLSAIQQVEQDFGFPVYSIVRLEELVRFLQNSDVSSIENLDQHLDNMRSYRDTYGV